MTTERKSKLAVLLNLIQGSQAKISQDHNIILRAEAVGAKRTKS